MTWLSAAQVRAFAAKRCTIVSVGYLVCKTAHYIAIAADLTNDGYYGRVTKIPNGMIASIEEV